MFRRIAQLFLVTVLVVAFQTIVAGTASAHHVTLAASAACTNNAVVISYTVTSYDQVDTAGSNPEVDILFNGLKVDAEALTLATNPKNAFSGQRITVLTGTVNVTALVIGTWGDGYAGGQSAAVSVAIPTGCGPSGTGRFTGGGKQVELGGLTITKGLELDCDLRPPNNLEINWTDGAGTHQFHMENFTSAVCSLNPDFSPVPPVAPINTMIGKGTGRFDGADGYTVEFTLEDHGEPGTQDRAGFKIYLTANPTQVVLNFPIQLLTKGNLQAHFDQN
jgi:hypothetical protein